MGVDKPKFDPWARSRRAEASRKLSREDDKVYRQTKAVKKRLIAERGRRCQQCGRMPATLDAHHLATIRQGGTNDESNIILLCESCHISEHFARKR